MSLCFVGFRNLGNGLVAARPSAASTYTGSHFGTVDPDVDSVNLTGKLP